MKPKHELIARRQENLSYREATAYISEGGQRGKTTLYAQYVLAPIVAEGQQADFIDYVVSQLPHRGDGASFRMTTIEEVVSVLNTEDVPSEFKRIIPFLEVITEIIRDKSKTNASDQRLLYVREVLNTFLADSEGIKRSSFAPHTQGSFASIVSFLQVYTKKTEQTMVSENWGDLTEGCRINFIQSLSSPAGQLYFSEESRELGAWVASDVPICVIDPLLSLVENKINSHLYGFFLPKERMVVVDPYTIKQFQKNNKATREGYDPTVSILRETVFHELVHALTNNRYFKETVINGEENLATLCYRKQWHSAWNEGITEKIATSLLAEMVEVSFHDEKTEERLRRGLANAPAHALTTTKALALMKQEELSYFKERLAIDTLFEVLDWKAAGLSREQAEDLAGRAFTEIPQGEVGNTSDRLSFVTACNEAAHPGFFMKWNALTQLYGTELAVDILLSPSFNPHDPSMMPWIASDALLNYYESKPDEQHKGILLRAAVEGLKKLLLDRHPERLHPDNQANKFRTFLGVDVRMVQRRRTVRDIRRGKAAIQSWLTFVAQNS